MVCGVGLQERGKPVRGHGPRLRTRALECFKGIWMRHVLELGSGAGVGEEAFPESID